MKHPDDSDQALEFMRAHALTLINNGISRDQAMDEAIDHWRRSLRRMQMIRCFEDDLRHRGKPTLHVSLFEAARIR